MDGVISIRRASVADADAVHAILLAGKDDIPLRCAFETDKYRAWVRDQCKAKNVWLAFIDIRHAGVEIIDVDVISYLVTAPDFRRVGVGRALVRHAVGYILKRCPGKHVKAEVWVENSAIIALLENEGFQRDLIQGVRPDSKGILRQTYFRRRAKKPRTSRQFD